MDPNAIEDDKSEGFLENVDEGILIPFHSCRMIGIKDSALNRNVRDQPTYQERNKPDYWDFEYWNLKKRVEKLNW